MFIALLFKRLRRIRIRGVRYRLSSLSIMMMSLVVRLRVHGLVLLLLQFWGRAPYVRS